MTRAIVVIGALLLGALVSPSSICAQDRAEALGTPPAADAPTETPPPPPEEVAPAPEAAAPTETSIPSAESRHAARLLSTMHLEEAALEREAGDAGSERMMAVMLYIGGVTLSIASVSLLVVAVLQGACVAEEDLGCYDTPEYVVAGLSTAFVGGVVLSGAAFAERRASTLEREVERHREELRDRRQQLERRVGLALGPGSLHLTLAF